MGCEGWIRVEYLELGGLFLAGTPGLFWLGNVAEADCRGGWR